MNKQDKIKELEKTITDAQAELDALNKPKRYKPEDDEVYFYRCGYGIFERVCNNDPTDKALYKLGNCYHTKEEAQRAYDRDVLLTEMWDDCDFDADWADDCQSKYALFYDYAGEYWKWTCSCASQISVYLPKYETKEDAQAAIAKYGPRMTELFIKRVGDER